jgi:1,4-alpha-glucan branching enzyme
LQKTGNNSFIFHVFRELQVIIKTSSHEEEGIVLKKPDSETIPSRLIHESGTYSGESKMLVQGKKRGEVTFIFNLNRDAKDVWLVGDFNRWQPGTGRMAKAKDGSFRLNIRLASGQHEYKFVADGQWLHDPEATAQVQNTFGTFNSVARVP